LVLERKYGEPASSKALSLMNLPPCRPPRIVIGGGGIDALLRLRGSSHRSRACAAG
jgi:hypothetical protein